MPEKHYLNKKEIARRYGVSTRTINSWMQRRLLPFTKPSAKMVRFDPEACDIAIQSYEHRSIFDATIQQEN
jgi:DNA-binding transcriptional MerR regulator